MKGSFASGIFCFCVKQQKMKLYSKRALQNIIPLYCGPIPVAVTSASETNIQAGSEDYV
jgi:hypothetical protein